MRFECHVCGARFESHGAMSAHRVGEFTPEPPDFGRRCLEDREMERAGYALRDGLWGRPLSRSDHTGRHHTAQVWNGPSGGMAGVSSYG